MSTTVLALRFFSRPEFCSTNASPKSAASRSSSDEFRQWTAEFITIGSGVARMSEAISGNPHSSFSVVPGFRCAHPGYKNKNRKQNADKRC